jgi:hypothetical protein
MRELMPHESATAYKLATLGSEGLPKGANRSADIP